MSIYEFYNSREEADYLLAIDHEITTPEAAYIVYQSKYTTLERKLAAWEEMAQDDVNLGLDTGFANFLRDYVRLQDRLLEVFYEPGNAVYQYATYQNVYDPGDGREGIWKYVEDSRYFPDFDTCYDAWFDGYKREGLVCPGARPPRIRFLRRELISAGERSCPCLWIETELRDKVITVQEQHILTGEEKRLNEAFLNLHFAFPTPFRRGDILVNNWVGKGGYKKGPFVLDRIEGDRYRAVYLDEYETGPHLFKGSDGPVLNLERYEEPLKGPQKVLKGVSLSLAEETKGNRQSDPAQRCRTYALILEEELCKSDKKNISRGMKKDEYGQIF